MTPNKRYWHELVGFNYRLTNLQAAIGVAQMERFPAILQKKREIFAHYQDRLQHVKGIAQLPKELDNSLYSHWLYTICLDKSLNRDEVMRQLLHQGVDTRPVFYPLHQMPPYQRFSKSESLYHSINIARSGLSLPSSLNLKIEEIEYITHVLTETLNKLHA
jgi:perosamine synthetase